MQLYIQELRITIFLYPTLKMGAAGLVHNVGTYLIHYVVSWHWENIKSDITLYGWSQLQPVAQMKVLKC